ncbi:helix-turn-helix domain-containing protein [Afifella marina]|uniref:Zn-dependent peptidase ImmA, M78 family n=3 Tax=Hyphomicrobiales TaxID=356 RepID=A0A1G5ME63_AFIMA|nr:XRE family transcriptional regulator [Afifella marina]SCZ23487.1 Zn-dependent peptidase ImmA, M78 family [Afifella marina DSM 2698]
MFGQRLKLARKRAGLSMQALADRATPSVSAQAISKYEADKMMPSSSVLVGLGKALGVSLDFLLGGQVKALESVEWRKNSTASAQDRAMAEAIVIDKLEDYLAIEDILDLHRGEDPFATLRVDHVVDEDAIEAKAREVRRVWKLGIDPIPSMTALLEDKGLKVIEADLPERINGLACHVERVEGSPTEVIVVSRHTNVERKRFNLAHELAHRIIIATGNAALKKEPSMHRFAGAFLIPREHLEGEAGRNRHGMTWIEIMRLKRTYGVSAAAMLVRLSQVGILSKSALEYAFKTYARSWRREEPEPIMPGEGFAAFEKPQRFERLVWRALGEEMISPVRAAQMLGLPLSVVERDIRGPRDL